MNSLRSLSLLKVAKATLMIFVCGLILGGCAAAPDFDVPRDQGTPTIKSITDRILCELASIAIDEKRYGFLLAADFQVEAQINLDVTNSGGVSPTFTYMAGPFSFLGGATLSGSRDQTFTYYAHYSLRQIYNRVTDNPRISECPNYDTSLAGEIGIRQTVDLALSGGDEDDTQKLQGTSGVFAGGATIVQTKALSGTGPTWTLVHFKGPGNFATLSQVNTDKLLYAFAPGPDRGKKWDRTKSIIPTSSLEARQALMQQNFIDLSTQLAKVGLQLH